MAGARIFEDVDGRRDRTVKSKSHKRTPSIGEILRGRKLKENDPSQDRADAGGTLRDARQSPLGERHLNSPPPSRRVTPQDEESRPKLHEKSKSSMSLKSLIRDKEKDQQQESGGLPSRNTTGQDHKPKKSKSSTNLAALLCKKSRRSAREGDSAQSHDQENITPPGSGDATPTPLSTHFAAQAPQDQQRNKHRPQFRSGAVESEISLYTPRDYSEYFPTQQRNFHDVYIPSTSPVKTPVKSPQRPLLEHRTSRNSVFKEDLSDDGPSPVTPVKSIERFASRSTPSKAVEPRPTLTPRDSNSSQCSVLSDKQVSQVLAATSTLHLHARDEQHSIATKQKAENPPSNSELDSVFEKVLDSLNIAHNMRDGMRKLKPEVKASLIKGERIGSALSGPAIQSEAHAPSTSSPSATKENSKPIAHGDDGKDANRSRSRPRSRVFTLNRRDDASPTKKQKSDDSTRSRTKSRPKSADASASRPMSMRSISLSSSVTSLSAPDSATTPGDFIHYLREVQKPALVDIGKMHKLRILLRNESVMWTEAFIKRGGMDEVIQLLHRIIKVEWREEHEDNLLHETLLCLKALCTTSLGLERLAQIEGGLFPTLLGMLFDEERKGPSEFSTRSIIIFLLFAHLSGPMQSHPHELPTRARTILDYLKDPVPEGDKQPLGFISQMHVSRPYRVWCKEVVNVTKEVFWIFLHHLNVIPTAVPQEEHHREGNRRFVDAHFPPPRPPHPAAPYVGGVEWEATQYLSMHLELLNGLIASLPTQQERNRLRNELKQSGWEKVMGGTLRTCKEKFYSGVHEGLRIWVSAAAEDGWRVENVRIGPPKEVSSGSPQKSPTRKGDEAPRLELNIGVGGGVGGGGPMGDGWI